MATVFYRPQALESIARRTLSEYDALYLNGSPRAVPIETIIEKTFGLRIEYQYLTNNARELGRMIYDSGITTYYNRDIMDYALMRVEGGTMLIECKQSSKICQNSPESIPLVGIREGTSRHKVYQSYMVSR